MDHFGIGAGVAGAAQVYFRSARRTGRTTSLVDSLKSGDRVIFDNPAEAGRVKALARERGVDVDCVCIEPGSPEILRIGTPLEECRTIFDHGWVERHYEIAIKRAIKEVDELQRRMSGYGGVHRETRRRAEEIAKWGGLGAEF